MITDSREENPGTGFYLSCFRIWSKLHCGYAVWTTWQGTNVIIFSRD